MSNMFLDIVQYSYFFTACALCLVLALGIRRLDRGSLTQKLGLSRGEKNGTTPPRSLSPEKKQPPPASASAGPNPDYSDAVPPSRREAFREMYDNLPEWFKQKYSSVEELVKGPYPEDRKKKPKYISHLEPIEQQSRDLLVPCGFTLEEVRMLGEFPDYAKLSGVPLPEECRLREIERAMPRPYRPFRWAYHQTMSLMKLDNDYWIELEKTYYDRIRQRKWLYENHRNLVLQALPGSELATKELMQMVVQYICARYPSYFTIEQPPANSSEPWILNNHLLGTNVDLTNTTPLQVLLENVPEDFGIVLRDPKTGGYYLRAALICSALGWNVDTKIGKRLNEIHEPVPDYAEKMRFSMDRFFSKMPTNKPIQRGSWGFEVDQPLFMPPGDPHEQHRFSQDPNLPLSRCHLRVDWQTLRRLPLSGAIVFNFKALFTPIEEFKSESYVPELALKVLKEGRRNLMEYKSTWHVEHVVAPALEEWAREQRGDGRVDKEWEVHTLEESPFFPGWEEKWLRMQGLLDDD